jgi:hypothetical protein
MTQYVQERVARLETPVTAWVLLSMIFALSCIYAYFIHGAIGNIVATKGMSSQISAVTSVIGNLEASYLAAKTSVSLEYAMASGFEVSKSDTIYVTKRSPASLSFNR